MFHEFIAKFISGTDNSGSNLYGGASHSGLCEVGNCWAGSGHMFSLSKDLAILIPTFAKVNEIVKFLKSTGSK
jgi:hypothetical protein